jgi:hypothetical protein
LRKHAPGTAQMIAPAARLSTSLRSLALAAGRLGDSHAVRRGVAAKSGGGEEYEACLGCA